MRSSLQLLLLGLLLLAWVVLPSGSTALAEPDVPADPCEPLFDGSESRIPAPLRGGPIGADLVARFPAINFTCTGSVSNGLGEIRGVFSELADDGGTVAIVVALGPLQGKAEYRQYLAETFPEISLEYWDTDGELGRSLIGWVSTHPRVAEAQRLHERSIGHVDLSNLASSLLEEGNAR